MKTKFVSSTVKGFLCPRPPPGNHGLVDACSQSCEHIDIGSPWLDVCVFINRSINKLAPLPLKSRVGIQIISVKGTRSRQAQLDGCVVWSAT